MINLKRVFNSHDRSPYTGVCTYVVIIASASLRLSEGVEMIPPFIF